MSSMRKKKRKKKRMLCCLSLPYDLKKNCHFYLYLKCGYVDIGVLMKLKLCCLVDSRLLRRRTARHQLEEAQEAQVGATSHLAHLLPLSTHQLKLKVFICTSIQ